MSQAECQRCRTRKKIPLLYESLQNVKTNSVYTYCIYIPPVYVEVTETYLVCDDAYIQNLNLVKQLSFVVFPSNGKYQTFTDGDEHQIPSIFEAASSSLLHTNKKRGGESKTQKDKIIKSLIV